MGEGHKPRKIRITFLKVFETTLCRAHGAPSFNDTHQCTVMANTALRALSQPLSQGILGTEAWRPEGRWERKGLGYSGQGDLGLSPHPPHTHTLGNRDSDMKKCHGLGWQLPFPWLTSKARQCPGYAWLRLKANLTAHQIPFRKPPPCMSVGVYLPHIALTSPGSRPCGSNTWKR